MNTKNKRMRGLVCALYVALLAWTAPTRGSLYGLSGAVGPTPFPQLIAIDTSDGHGTPIGPPITIHISDAGLALDPLRHVLYAVNGNAVLPPDLLMIDPATAATTIVGPLGYDWSDSGLAFDPLSRILYATEETSNQLFTIDINTGHASPVGPLNIDIGNTGLAFNPVTGDLIGVSMGTLFRLDTGTGQATIIADFGARHFTGLDFDPTSQRFFASEDPGGVDSFLYTFDFGTGPITLTPIGPIGFPNVEGLAYMPAIPAPGAVLLGGIGAGLVGWLRRRRAV